jgi:hypothetical protein
VVLLLILAPGLFVITTADARPHQGPAEPERAGGLAVRADSRAAAPGGGTAGLGGSAAQSAANGSGAVASSGSPARVSPASAAPDSGGAIKLLREAADAGRTVPYRGVQVISWWGPQGTTTMVVDVAHEPGNGTLLQMAGTGAEPAAATYVADTPGIREPSSPDRRGPPR